MISLELIGTWDTKQQQFASYLAMFGCFKIKHRIKKPIFNLGLEHADPESCVTHIDTTESINDFANATF